jgi:hypothetical protein
MGVRLPLLAAAAAAAALALAGSAGAVTDSYDGVVFYPFTMAPGNMDCVDWHDDVAGWAKNCDPVDVLFPGQTLDVVIARLHAAGWIDTGGGTQYLYFADQASVAAEAQLAIADGNDPTMRYHVRLWQAGPTLVVGGVHHEHGTPHKIDLDWDAAEAFLAHDLCSSWCARAYLPTQDAMQNHTGTWRGWANDATATVIPLAPPAPAAVPVTAKKKHPHKQKHHAAG